MGSARGSLNEKDMEFVETLRELGVSRNLARLIAYLASSGGSSSKEIENTAGLSQSGVSISIRALRENGWIEEGKVRKGKSGKLVSVYSLKVEIDEIISHFEREKLNESAQAMVCIQRLKELAST